MSNKGKNFLLGILPPICVFVLQNLVSVVVAEFMYVYKGATFSGSDFTEFYEGVVKSLTGKTYSSLTLFFYGLLALFLYGYWYSRKRCQFEQRSISLKGFRPVFLIIGVILFVLGAQVVSNFLVSLVSAVFPKALTQYMKMLRASGLDGDLPPLMIIYTAVLGPISEELAFRGLSLGYFKKSMTFAWANVLQALLFGLIHGNAIQFVYAFVLGLLFGYIAHRTGSILVTIILHICFNSTSFVIETLCHNAVSGGAFLAFGMLVLSMMAVYVGVIFVIASQPMAKEK